MKRIAALFLALFIIATAFVACTQPNTDNNENNNDNTNNENNNDNGNNENNTPTENEYTLSIGVVVTENLATLKLTETVATLVTDKDGKIVLCRIDCVDYSGKYDTEGALITTAPTSKVTLGDAYSGMPAGSWATQGAAFEQFVIGKTQAEVTALVNENGYAADAELIASCSINISDIAKAVDNAFKSANKVTFKTTAESFTAGLNYKGAVKDASTDESKSITFTATYAATVLVEGKVVAAILDCAEASLKDITDDGAASVSFAGTKREQGDNYTMTSGAWYVQADAYAKAAEGKSAADIATIATEGVAGCTMPYSTYDFKAALESAVASAR